MKVTYTDLSSCCGVDSCNGVGEFWFETDEDDMVALLCKRHAYELVNVALPDKPRYVIVEDHATKLFSVVDTYILNDTQNRPVGINLGDLYETKAFSREAAEKLLEVIQLLELRQ